MNKHYCTQCRMSFRIGEAPNSRTERNRCPDCGQQFWCSAPSYESVVVVGVEPSDIPVPVE